MRVTRVMVEAARRAEFGYYQKGRLIGADRDCAQTQPEEIGVMTHPTSRTLLNGPISLGQVADQLSLLDVSCHRCGRSGRFRVERLLARHGPHLPLPALCRILAVDCPRMQAQQVHDVCGAHFPALLTPKL